MPTEGYHSYTTQLSANGPGISCLQSKSQVEHELQIDARLPFSGLSIDLAEQINRAKYHRLTMQQSTIVGNDHSGQYFGHMVADNTINRLEARPVNTSKSIFMGASAF